VKYADPRFFEHTVLAAHSEGDYFERRALGEFKRLGVRVELLYDDLSRLPSLLKEFDVVHYPQGKYSDTVFQMAHHYNVPLVVEHNMYGYTDPPETERAVDLRLCVSKTSLMMYKRRARLNMDALLRKNLVLYEPVDVEPFQKFKPSETEIESFRHSLGVDDDTFLVGRVSRLDVAKWIPSQVQMLWRLVRKVKAKLLVVGGIPDWVQDKIRRYGLEDRVINFGVATLPQLVKCYYSMDAYGFSSRDGEMFGRVLAEAMLAGKPIVMPATPWFGEDAQIEIVDNGVDGLIVWDVKSFADALAFLAQHKFDAEQMGKCGQKKISSLFSGEVNTRVLEKHYVDALQRKKVKVDREIVEAYGNVQLFPSIESIREFPSEQVRRLHNIFGSPSVPERLWFTFKTVSQQRPRRGYIWKDMHCHVPPIL
jgi:glycosyltransferase involved in cell wall biosynthesis